jgi:hypothetical protein
MKKQIGWDVVTLFQMCRSKDNNRSTKKEVKIKIYLEYIYLNIFHTSYYILMELTISLLYQRWI